MEEDANQFPTKELLDNVPIVEDGVVRGELRACRQRIELIAKQQASVAAEVAAGREANNTASVGRLQAVSRRLCTELDDERALQSQLRAALLKSESAMWHIAIQKGQLEDVQASAQEEEAAARKGLRAHAAEQLPREEEALKKAERTRLLRVRKAMHLQKEHGLRHQKLVEDAKKNHKIAVKFLKASLGRIREQEREKEMGSQEHMKRRMDAVLALKNSISANRETLRKFQAWGQARAELAEQKARAQKEMILAQGGDAFRHLFHQRQRQELEAQNRAFEEQQRLRKQEIVGRILKEEAAGETRRKRQSSPTKATGRLTLRDETWGYISDVCEDRGTVALPRNLPQDSEAVSPPRASQLLEANSYESVQGDSGSITREHDTLAEPEIPGLWKEDYKPNRVPKEEVDRKPVGGTKMDKDILARTMEQLRSRVTHRQVASGHEFKGRPFNSKPKLVHFKDFDVGKVYKKKITLINATYTINHCKLVGVEEHLRDFVHVDFDPPGPMSAGMSCEVLVTFKPMINKDLEGSVSFLAQTGGFSVPLKCSTKKCMLSLDKELIDFGSYVVGETASRIVTLTNIGGLGTEFKFLRASESCEMDISQSVAKTVSRESSQDFPPLRMMLVVDFSSATPLEQDSSTVPTRTPKSHKEGKPAVADLVVQESEGVTMSTVMTIPPNEEQTEISLGEVAEGEIGPFGSIKVPVIFTPIIPGAVYTKFKVVFKNQQCPTCLPGARSQQTATAAASSSPSSCVPARQPAPCATSRVQDMPRKKLLRNSYKQKHCHRTETGKSPMQKDGHRGSLQDFHPYEAVLRLEAGPGYTRSKTALRLKFEVCKELRGHMELLPETGYIQAQSSYTVQLKFLPRHSLPEDAGKYFDKESRVLEAPMTIRVADQIKPVGFTVHAVVTTSDLELSPSAVDFGHCTVYEAVRTQVSLCNLSLLPQGFGFVGLPKFVDVQPSDGFGTILPLETLQLDVIFQPTKAKEYNFELVCKSEINRCFKLSCRAVGVRPPLGLSHYQVKFAATSLYHTSVATLYVINSHVSMSSLTHSAPRVGSEDVPPVGPTTFEFLPPPDSPITISPLVGTVLPGKRCLVQVAFRPVLPTKLILQEALQTLTKEAEVKSPCKDTVTQRKDLRRQSSTLRLQGRDHPPRASTTQAAKLQKLDLKPSLTLRAGGDPAVPDPCIPSSATPASPGAE
ncbi:cilia- and flagella-associated protein 74 [Puma concolor]|uniref:Cilia- and flagella-associated protein 74 n=1 Tax=Puma concolor TaxID=9696 RepID=A0A6P6GWV7_PUMCO|nr:cilia- and flagella-associated protein 74 [Puma concolor]